MAGQGRYGEPGDEVRKITVGLDGEWFELHLDAAEAAMLRAVVERFVQVARRPSATRPAPARSADAGPAKAVRAWARANGYRVTDRGRISALVLEAYERAHPGYSGTDAARNERDHPKWLNAAKRL
jgi:Lsr2